MVENLKDVLVIHGDGTDHDLLREENFANMDALVTLTGSDEENLLLALLGKQQGIPSVVAKISRSNFIPIIEQLGIDRAVNPVLISASEILRFVQGSQIASIELLLDGQAEVVEIIIEAGTGVIGRTLARMDLPKGVMIGAIVRDDQVIIPDGSSEMAVGDRAIVFCLREICPYWKSCSTAAREAFSMNYGIVRRVLGNILKIEAALMLIPIGLSLVWQEFSTASALSGQH